MAVKAHLVRRFPLIIKLMKKILLLLMMLPIISRAQSYRCSFNVKVLSSELFAPIIDSIRLTMPNGQKIMTSIYGYIDVPKYPTLIEVKTSHYPIGIGFTQIPIQSIADSCSWKVKTLNLSSGYTGLPFPSYSNYDVYSNIRKTPNIEVNKFCFFQDQTFLKVPCSFKNEMFGCTNTETHWEYSLKPDTVINGVTTSFFSPLPNESGNDFMLNKSIYLSLTQNKYGVPVYFKISRRGNYLINGIFGPFDALIGPSEVLNQVIYYPSFPLPQTKTAIAPPCFGSNGSITLTDFKYDDGSSYVGGENLTLTITNQASGIPEAPIIFATNAITIPNLAPGNYTAQLGNAAATCTSNFTFTIPPTPPIISATAISQNPDCSTGLGVVTVNAIGGTPPYQYSINSGSSYQASNTFNGLAAGNYTVTVTDANNCAAVSTNQVSITIPTAVTIALSNKTNPTAFGASNGQIIVSANGGAGSNYTYAINGGAYTSSDSFSGLPAGTYLITAKDSKGCESSALSVVLTAPSSLALNIAAQINNSCYGDASGSLEVTATGGTPPYTYALNGGIYQPSNFFGNLIAGDYSMSVKDINGVVATVNAAILQPNKVTAMVSKTDATCFGANGTITVNNPTGGLGTAYTYSSDGGSNFQNSNSFSLPQGTYPIIIKDTNGCVSDPYNITILQPAASLQATATTQNVKCYSGADGVITINATGGSGSYIYSKDNWITTQSTNIFTGLAAGQYEVKVKDQTGCMFSLPVQIKQPQELVLLIDGKTDATCFGGTGTISVSAIGGEGNISYSSNPSLPFSNGLFTGATAGSYTIQITDENGCTKTTSVTIDQPNQIIVNVTVAAVSCNGAADGKVTLLATGGTGAYTYSIKNLNNFTASNVFSGLAAGNYIFTVKDQNGCTADVAANVAQPLTLTVAVVQKQNVSCNGANNGSFTINANGGSTPYSYQINGIDNGANANFSNLSPGNYAIRVTDVNGCYKEVVETITQPTQLNLILVNQTDVKCFGSNSGEISVTATGGTGPYQYAINGAAYQSNSIFKNLAAASYAVQVKDANQCIQSLSVIISEPQKLAAMISKQDIKCFGEASGQITVNAAGGEAPYAYSLNGNGFQLNPVFANLLAGNYTIVIQDRHNCQITKQVAVFNIAPKLTFSILGTSPTTCDGVGAISVTNVSGGVAPYEFSIDGSNFSSPTSFNGLFAGTYTVFVKDSNGCVASQTTTISIPTGISAKASATDVSCFSAADGSIAITNVIGGNGNYSYAINGGNFQSSNLFTGMAAGNYNIIVKDSPYSCQYQLNVTIAQPNQLSVQLNSKTDISCYGQNNGALAVSVNGGTMPYLYSIDGGNTFNTSASFSGLTAKAYTVLVKDANQCSSAITTMLSEPALLALSLSSKADVSCFGAKDGSIIVSAQGGTAPYRYTLNGSSPQSANRFDNLSGGSYILNVIDANGCSTNIFAFINENPALNLTLSAFKNLSCNGNASGEITVSAIGGSGNYQYRLNNGSYQNSAFFSQLPAGQYQITVKDDKGCTASLIQLITEPSVLKLTKQVTQQQCFDVCSGEIKLSVTGGTAPYSYQWSGGIYGSVSTISNLCGGLYKVTIVDANGCTIEDATNIITPPEIRINGIADTVLCVDQVVTYDAGNPGLRYEWTADNGFARSTQRVQISAAGKYQLKVTNADGCSVRKTFTVQTSTTLLKANFLVSTYANVGDTVIIVDVSKPTPAKTSWLFDKGTIDLGGNSLSTVKQVAFSSPGVYNLMMMVNLGQCTDAVQKSITILPKEQKAAVNIALGYKEDLIKEFKVYPNPTNGEFKVTVKLSEQKEIKTSLYNFNGSLLFGPQKHAASTNFEINYSQTQLPPGLYVLTVEAGEQLKNLKIIKL